MSIDVPVRKKSISQLDWEERIGLAAFERYKEALLASLRNPYEAGPKSAPFDADKSWRGLTRLAKIYLWAKRGKQESVPAGARVKRLDQLAGALGRARGMAEKAMQDDDVGIELRKGWFAATNLVNIPLVSALRNDKAAPLRIADEIKQVVAGLTVLEAAARRAADDMKRAPGRPKGTAVLPTECIVGLARIYRNSTGSKPGACEGPFARFVFEFATALGPGRIEYESVIDAIKDARTWSLGPAAGCDWGPSPFDE
jgi:hypothetical protein